MGKGSGASFAYWPHLHIARICILPSFPGINGIWEFIPWDLGNSVNIPRDLGLGEKWEWHGKNGNWGMAIPKFPNWIHSQHHFPYFLSQKSPEFPNFPNLNPNIPPPKRKEKKTPNPSVFDMDPDFFPKFCLWNSPLLLQLKMNQISAKIPTFSRREKSRIRSRATLEWPKFQIFNPKMAKIPKFWPQNGQNPRFLTKIPDFFTLEWPKFQIFKLLMAEKNGFFFSPGFSGNLGSWGIGCLQKWENWEKLGEKWGGGEVGNRFSQGIPKSWAKIPRIFQIYGLGKARFGEFWELLREFGGGIESDPKKP